jgi:hypothetical protein
MNTMIEARNSIRELRGYYAVYAKLLELLAANSDISLALLRQACVEHGTTIEEWYQIRDLDEQSRNTIRQQACNLLGLTPEAQRMLFGS